VSLPGNFTSFDKTHIAFRSYGSASDLVPVVFCSGIACNDVYWRSLAPALASEGRLALTWDYPRHGDSGPPGDPSEIGVVSMARHVLALMDRLDIPKAVLIGHSMGVQVALETYRLSGGRVAGLVAIAGPYGQTVGNLYGTGLGVILLEILQRAAKLNPKMAKVLWVKACAPSVADPVGRAGGLIGKAPKQVMNEYFRHLQRFEPSELFAMFKAAHQHTAEDLLPMIAVPTLIIHGTRDVMSPFFLAQRMEEKIPHARLIAVDSGAHTLPVEQPEMIAEEVGDFLKQIVPLGQSSPR